MGTEQQQEFKSVKPCTKPKRKVIPFNDHSIEAWKPKKDKDRIGFVFALISLDTKWFSYSL